MNNFVSVIQFFLFVTAELTVLFLGISTVVTIILMYMPQDKLKNWLAHRGIWGNFLGATVGSLTPFCACSTIPMTLGMLSAGAPFGSVMSFIIASPLLNPIIISMVWVLMGTKASLIYFFVTFFGSILFGVFLEKIGGAKYVKKVRIQSKCCCANNESVNIPINFSKKLKASFISAWSDFRAILIYLLIGISIGAVIYGYIPQNFVTKIAGPNNPFAIPIAAIIGVPLYIRAETAIPIGLALSQKGMSVGAVIALIIGGAGMAIPEMIMLAGIFKKRLVSAIVIVIWATAVIGGYVFNSML